MRKTTLFILYTIGFVFALSRAIPAYVNSSFLSTFVGEKFVGFVFTLCSLVALSVFFIIPKILKRFGNYKTTIFFSILSSLSFFLLSLTDNKYVVLFSFLIIYVSGTMIGFCLDVFLENNSTDNDTGKIRSFYLTGMNISWLISPWLSGLILFGQGYNRIYFVVALIMIPIIFMVSYNLKSFKDSEYKDFKIISTLKESWSRKDIRCILFSGFLLNFFYAWMVIYTPIYLFKYVGFNWQEIGLIFTMMLLPFVLIQIPLGKLADKYFGEKEMLTVGFLIMAISTAFIPFISGKDFWVWGILLLITRIGAAIVEIMSETYFFKKISDKNVNLISVFRSMSSFAYIISPIIATVFFCFLPFKYIFFVLAFLMLFGLRYSLAIKDTK
jgi:MFS family permease